MQRKSGIFVDLKNKGFSNNKKLILLLLMGLLLFGMMSTAVAAQAEGPFAKIVKTIGEGVRGVFGEFGKDPGIWIKSLAFFLIFAVLYSGAAAAKLFPRNINMSLAIIISLITVLIIPTSLFEVLAVGYAAAVISVISIGTLLIFGWLHYNIHKTKIRGLQLIAILFWLVFIGLTASLTEALEDVSLPNLPDVTLPSWVYTIETLSFLIAVGAIVFALYVVFSGAKEYEGEGKKFFKDFFKGDEAVQASNQLSGLIDMAGKVSDDNSLRKFKKYTSRWMNTFHRDAKTELKKAGKDISTYKANAEKAVTEIHKISKYETWESKRDEIIDHLTGALSALEDIN